MTLFTKEIDGLVYLWRGRENPVMTNKKEVEKITKEVMEHFDLDAQDARTLAMVYLYLKLRKNSTLSYPALTDGGLRPL
jgi:hypothetical protein